MQEDDLQALRTAVATLEHPGLAARLAEIDAFRQDAAINNKASSFSNRLGEQPTYRKVAAVRRICPAFEPAQGEHLP